MDPPTRPSIGDPLVDEALDRLDQAMTQPLARHVEAAERVHADLGARLADLGDA